MDDEAAISAVRQGEVDAFSFLVERYQDQLYTMALRLLGSPSDAADVVQETFTRAFTHVQQLRADTVRAWLFRVATNCARDVQRRSVRRPAMSIDSDATNVVELPDSRPRPEDNALARELSVAIRHALAELSLEHREVVVLRDINDLSYEEIASVLGCPIGTVRSRLSRGRLQLVERLRESSGGLFSATGEIS